jgi:hypothetical protein
MAALEQMLSENAKRPKRERVTYEHMLAERRLSGYAGGYDAKSADIYSACKVAVQQDGVLLRRPIKA